MYLLSMPKDIPDERDLQRRLPPYEREEYEVLKSYGEPQDGDRLVLEQLLQYGADLSKARHVVHYLYFDSTEGRARAEIQLVGTGYKTTFGVTVEGDRPWSLICERVGIVNEEQIERERVFLDGVASANRGFYDGWEAQLD